MAGRDLSAELYGDEKSTGRDLSAELYGDAPKETKRSRFDTIVEAHKQARNEGLKMAGNIGAGALRGAGSIGATILWPWDKAQDMYHGDREQTMSRNEERREGMDGGLRELGADTDSYAFQGGKLAGEVAGTAGVGTVLANGARAIPAIAKLAPALQSGGFNLGNAATKSVLANTALRAGSGAAVGGASAGLIKPEYATSGAALGGALPPAVMLAGKASNFVSNGVKWSAEKLMQAAIKPTIKQLQSGDSAIAVRTLLDNGINPNEAGVDKLRGMVDSTNQQIKSVIGSSNATISKQDVLNTLNGVRGKFGNQVSPTSDLAAIQNVADDFSAHPSLAGNDIPVQLAQELKQGTYKVLSKKYGQLGNAETEAQKALARGLKEGIADKIPAIQGLNKTEADLIKTLKVTERRALMEMNKNPGGLALLAGNPVGFAAFMADKSALFKSLTARALNTSASVPKSLGLLENQMESPLIRSGLLSISGNQASQR